MAVEHKHDEPQSLVMDELSKVVQRFDADEWDTTRRLFLMVWTGYWLRTRCYFSTGEWESSIRGVQQPTQTAITHIRTAQERRSLVRTIALALRPLGKDLTCTLLHWVLL